MHIKVLTVLGTVLVGWCVLFNVISANADQANRITSSPFLTTRWTTENGLPQNSVTTIVQTPDGYLWLGTFGGLARFDGLKFTIFNSGNTPALPSNRITALHVGRDGNLWIGTETGDISRFHNGNFSFFTQIPADASGSKIIHAIYQDRSGALWVGAEKWGLTRFAASNSARAKMFNERHGLPPYTVNGICEDRDGDLWVCMTGGLARFQNGQQGQEKREGQFTVYLKRDPNDKKVVSDHLLRIRPHPDGGLWLLTQNNLGRFHEGSFTPYLKYSHHPESIAGLSEGATGNLLFSYGADRIFNIGQNAKGSVTERKVEELQPFLVVALFEDREGNIWLGTIGNGLIRLRARRVTMLNSTNGLPDTGGGPILQDRHGDIWIGFMNGICRLSGEVLTTYLTQAMRKQKEGSKIGALYQDRAGDLWIGKDNSLARYRNGHFTEYPLWGTGFISSILEDRQGRMWLGTWDGLAQFQDGRLTMYRQSEGIVHNDVKFMLEDRAGAIWLGTPGGLSRFQNGVFTNFTVGAGGGLSNNFVRAIHEDADGTLWIGTYGGGLNRLRNGQFTHITAKQGLFDDFISRILVGDNDTFWLLGNRGIFQVSRQALNEVADGQRQSVKCQVYDAADGMNPSEGQGGFQPAGWRGSDGRLWFPTIHGVAVVDPNLSNNLPPPVIIERVLLDGAELDARQPIEIPPGKGNLEIQYTGLSLSKPEQIQFSFKLSGQNETWMDVGQRRTAYFPQLQPGRYRFSVKALSPDGVWSEREANLDFIVRPHFWQTVWFLSLVAMALAGLALAGYRWRMAFYRKRTAQQEAFTRQLIESQEQERKRIAAELHDGLGQSLIIIKRRGLLCLDAGEAHQEVLEQVQEIVEASTHAIEEVREMIFDLRPQQLDRLGLIGAVSDLLTRAASVNGWQLTRQLDEVDGLFSEEAENSLYRIVQESVNNVSKHAAATHVAVSICRQSSWVELTIQDNGRGFVMETGTNAARRNGFGLRGIAERARFLDGYANIESAPENGTTVRLRLPLGKNSKNAHSPKSNRSAAC